MVGGYHIMIDTMKEKYYDQAVACVKDYVLLIVVCPNLDNSKGINSATPPLSIACE